MRSLTGESSRRQNITGVKYLSIGRDRNCKGDTLYKYQCSVLQKDGSRASHSCYFGKRFSQQEAFNVMIEFIHVVGGLESTKKQALGKFESYGHEDLYKQMVLNNV